MLQLLQTFDSIKQSIPENEPELKQFLRIYKTLGMHIDYDKSGCIGEPEYIDGNDKITRSLKGCLLEGRGVCVGYAHALEQVCSYIGIHSEYKSGMAHTQNGSGGHAWNQVLIEGKPYNVDLTWDSRRLKNNIPVEYCLRGDEFFNETHESFNNKSTICKEDYPQETIQQILSELPQYGINGINPQEKSVIGPKNTERIPQVTTSQLQSMALNVAEQGSTTVSQVGKCLKNIEEQKEKPNPERGEQIEY
ncbi:MAG: hypothetical protein J6A89_07370 [Clostridia bacterium]|nr:hypothetical protein [Clostridia bacterium]